MLGTVINACAIILATIVGLLFSRGLSDKMSKTLIDGLGLIMIIIGIQMGIKADSLVIVALSLASGGVIGEWLKIQDWLEGLGDRIETRFSIKGSPLGMAFITSSLLFCTGAMAIMGPLENGLTGRYDILLVKSLLDGIFSFIFATTMGIGVMFSAIPVFLYQGSISLLAELIKPLLTPDILNNLTSLGGILILGLGINNLNLTNIKVANLLPGLLLVPLITAIIRLFL